MCGCALSCVKWMVVITIRQKYVPQKFWAIDKSIRIRISCLDRNAICSFSKQNKKKTNSFPAFRCRFVDSSQSAQSAREMIDCVSCSVQFDAMNVEHDKLRLKCFTEFRINIYLRIGRGRCGYSLSFILMYELVMCVWVCVRSSNAVAPLKWIKTKKSLMYTFESYTFERCT